MTDRFLFSILSTAGIISGVTSLSFGSAYVVGKYMPKLKQIKYTSKKIAKITSIEDIREYEDVQGCMFLFKNKNGINPVKTNVLSSTAAIPNSEPRNTEIQEYQSLEAFRKSHNSSNDNKIIEAADGQKSQCNNGAAVYIRI